MPSNSPIRYELQAADCWFPDTDRVPRDPATTAWKRTARLRQARWREEHGHPKGVTGGPKSRPIGSRTDLDHAKQTGANFLTPNVLAAVKARLAAPERFQMLKEDRLRCGAGVGFAVLNAMYRDVRHLIPFLTQLLLFATPVAYSSEIVPARWRWLLALNPLTPIMQTFRAAVLGTAVPGMATLGWSALSGCVVLVLGTLLFRRLELVLVDVV